jgi:phage terminase large subunit-like protein
MLEMALRKGDDGLYLYDVVIWSDIKKSAKSTCAAAVMLWMNATRPFSQCVSVANDLKQADSRVAYYYRRALQLNKELGARVKTRGYKASWDNGSEFEAVPIDPTGEAGGGADIVCFSELWGAHSKAQQQMWSEQTLSPLKYGTSFRWVESYAGYAGKSVTLERLYHHGLAGQQVSTEPPIWVNGRQIMMWNQTPRLPWHTQEYLASQAAQLTASEYRRLIGNEWVSSQEKFVPDAWWNACERQYAPMVEGEMLVMSMDAGIVNDCFALVGVGRAPGAEEDSVCVRYCRVWRPEKGHTLEDFAPMEEEIRHIAEMFNVVNWVYDPHQLTYTCTKLGKEGVGLFTPFPQGQQRAVADKMLYDVIRDRKLWHPGDSVLTDHVQNADAKPEGDKKLRLVKRSESLKIDAAVALSQGVYECLRLNL